MASIPQLWRCSWAAATEAETLRPEDDEAALSSDDDDDDDESDGEEDEDSSEEEGDEYSSAEKEDEDSSQDEDEEDEDSSEDEEDEDSSEDEEDEDSSEDDDDSDEEDFEYSTEEEESHGEVNRQAAMACSAGEDVMLQRRKFVPVGQFVGGPEPRFASAGSTAGFMQVAAVETHEGDNSDRQISVLYRCTHFLGASRGGVRVRERTSVYQLRFVVPPAGDTARSLLCVGVSVASLLYPARFNKGLQRLWSSLIAELSVPTRASLLEVLVDFGILRSADRTAKRMELMSAALEGMVRKDFHPELHLEIQLPQAAQCGAGEDCAICWELLEGDDLAAWPGCCKPHVFHGACMELILKRDDKCPLCRSVWFIEPKPLNIRKQKDESRDNHVDRHFDRVSSDAAVDAKNVKQAVAIFVRLYDNIRRFKTQYL
ncbi:hypothetical protein ACQ4PT_031448 [Festuca glaucescens]